MHISNFYEFCHFRLRQRKDDRLHSVGSTECTPACDVISVRKANGQRASASKRARFTVPSADADPTTPSPVSVFHHRNTTLDETPPNPTDEPNDVIRQACNYCLQPSCITLSPFKPQGQSNARITNHTKRRKDYKWYWRTLKDCGLWDNPVYQQRKEDLGCHIDDVREVMPHCVIKDVRGRWPNPPHVPYQGHQRA